MSWPLTRMTDIIEIHWNARLHLARLGIKVKAAPLDPRVADLFSEIRNGAADLFPDCVTLVRISIRNGDPDAPLRIARAGADTQTGLEAMRALVDNALARAEASAG
jgi:hypothetical protein